MPQPPSAPSSTGREAELDKDSALIPLFYSVRLQLVKPGVSGFSTKDPLANWQVKDWTFKQK